MVFCCDKQLHGSERMMYYVSANSILCNFICAIPDFLVHVVYHVYPIHLSFVVVFVGVRTHGNTKHKECILTLACQ